jgi:dimethylaniline monooxygenase (N-oxide forming)
MSEVCVVGGGFAGIITAKTLRQDGFKVTIFEARSSYGGVWNSKATVGAYINLKANNSAFSFRFSDVDHDPLPSSATNPDGLELRGEDVLVYCQKFVRFHDLESLMKFNMKVVRCFKQDGDTKWTIVVQNTISKEEMSSQFDFVVVASGLFQNPKIPAWPGRENIRRSHLPQFAGPI